MAVGKIKNCVVCGDVFEDRTKPKNKKTCSKMCAKQAKNKHQRIKYREENPPKPNQRQLYYYDRLEYPYWVGDGRIGDQERIANNQFYKHETVKSNESLEYIQGAIERYEQMGGRKRHDEYEADYEGEEDSRSFIIYFAKHDDKEPGEVIEYKMTPEELQKYRESRWK